MPNTVDHHNIDFGGYTWARPPAGPFALKNITRVKGRINDPTYRISHSRWVLDYFGGLGVKVRVGSEKAPWRERDTFTAHLYPPNTAYWEDFGTQGRALFSSWLNFDASPRLGLDPLVQNKFKIARFYDPDRILDRLFLELESKARHLGEEGYWDAAPAFLKILSHLRCSLPAGPVLYQISDSPEADMKHWLVARIQHYFRTHLGEHIDIATLSKQVHMAPSALIRRYRLETGIPP